MHGGPPHRLAVRQVASIVLWATGPVLLSVLLASSGVGWAGAPILAYAVLWMRARSVTRRRGYDGSIASLYAASCVVGKFAEFAGVVRFGLNRLVYRRRSDLIEYKAER